MMPFNHFYLIMVLDKLKFAMLESIMVLLVICYLFSIYDIKEISKLLNKKNECEFDGCVPKNINCYALVITKKMVFLGSDARKNFELLWA